MHRRRARIRSRVGYRSGATYPPAWLIFLFIFFLPPAAWYFLLEEQRYRRWLRPLLGIYGGFWLLLVFASLLGFYVDADFHVDLFRRRAYYDLPLLPLFAVFSVTQLGIAALMLKGKVVGNHTISRALAAAALGLLMADHLLLGWTSPAQLLGGHLLAGLRLLYYLLVSANLV
jgi:hypothetical protein